MKEKDAYDIAYAVHGYPGGPARLAEEFRPHLEHALMREGLGKIRSKFRTPEDAGPHWAADFLAEVDPETRAILQRRVFIQTPIGAASLGGDLEETP